MSITSVVNGLKVTYDIHPTKSRFKEYLLNDNYRRALIDKFGAELRIIGSYRKPNIAMCDRDELTISSWSPSEQLPYAYNTFNSVIQIGVHNEEGDLINDGITVCTVDPGNKSVYTIDYYLIDARGNIDVYRKVKGTSSVSFMRRL